MTGTGSAATKYDQILSRILGRNGKRVSSMPRTSREYVRAIAKPVAVAATKIITSSSVHLR
jgi:hypothetical protein